jgi:hypothetical protein
MIGQGKDALIVQMGTNAPSGPGRNLGVPTRCKDLTTSARSLAMTKRFYFAWVSVGCWISATGKCVRYSTTPSAETGSYSLYATFAFGCVNPTGNERYIIYNSDFHALQYCNGAAWYPLGASSGGGGGGCTNPTGAEKGIAYNNDYHTYQYCNGTNWVKFSGGSSIPLPGPSDGYFVMSKSTWQGNLGPEMHIQGH